MTNELPEYDDAYSACSETFATLRIYHDEIPPTEVTSRLGVKPDESVTKGERFSGKRRGVARTNGWFLTTDGKVDSRDSRRHIDWLTSQVSDKAQEFAQMLEDGFEIDISSFWISRSGNGGPMLSPFQMRRLAELGIEVNWDIYFENDDYSEGKSAEDDSSRP